MNNMNKQLGTKWFTFYTKVRPWFACLAVFTVISDFVQYQEVYTSYWWMMLYFISSVIQAVLAVLVFAKSYGNYINFVKFVTNVLFFETIYMAYSQGVQQYVQNEFDINVAVIVGIIVLILGYFIWYCLNMRYFNKRIIPAYYGSDTYNQATYTTQNVSMESSKTAFCRKCGNKLLEDSRFCNKCGTEIINEE